MKPSYSILDTIADSLNVYYEQVQREAERARSRAEARDSDNSLRKIERAINFVYKELGISTKVLR
jgi:hypothetical protein